MITSLNKVRGHLAEATLWRTELHWPQEVVSFLKVLTHCVNLVDEILNADDTTLAQLLLNDGVVSDGNALFVDLAIATLVDQLPHTLQIWVSKRIKTNYQLYNRHVAQDWVLGMLWLAKK